VFDFVYLKLITFEPHLDLIFLQGMVLLFVIKMIYPFDLIVLFHFFD